VLFVNQSIINQSMEVVEASAQPRADAMPQRKGYVRPVFRSQLLVMTSSIKP
jgi:hypothetical protein